MTDYQTRIAENLRQYREENNLSQSKLSKMCGLHRSYVGKIERGEKIPSLETLTAIADALFLPVEQLMGQNGPNGNRSETEGDASESVYKRVFDQIPRPLAVLDNRGLVTRVNEAFEKLVDPSREDLLECQVGNLEALPAADELHSVLTSRSQRPKSSNRFLMQNRRYRLSLLGSNQGNPERYLLEVLFDDGTDGEVSFLNDSL